MPKSKKPAPKGGKKAAAPKKVAKRVVAQKARRQGVSTAAAVLKQFADPGPSYFIDRVGEAGSDAPIELLTEHTATLPLHPTVEEQFDRDASLMQALHDPENQPSQYGTVPMSYLDNLPASYCDRPSLLRRAINRVKRAFRFRSAKSGEYVTPEFAAANPDTTVREKA